MKNPPCQLCGFSPLEYLGTDTIRRYNRCSECELITIPPEFYLSAEAEKNRYALHDNTRNNEEYVRYLNQIITVAKSIPAEGKTVLDFGCGENAVLTHLLNEQGYACVAYDPLYGLTVGIGNSYDLIVVCESIEHFKNIAAGIGDIDARCLPQGYILIKTTLYTDPGLFLKWWYKNDLTHINFFSPKTIRQLCEIFDRPLAYSDEKSLFVFGPQQKLG